MVQSSINKATDSSPTVISCLVFSVFVTQTTGMSCHSYYHINRNPNAESQNMLTTINKTVVTQTEGSVKLERSMLRRGLTSYGQAENQQIE